MVGHYALGLGEHIIGRDPDAAICIEVNSISHQHAKLILSAGATELEDMGSTSGTFVDGAAVRGRILLAPGQTVYLSNLYVDIERSVIGELVVGGRLADGRFTLIEKLGQGGMGAVWKAMDRETGQPVALKLLPSEMSTDSARLRDLEREVAKTKALQHPNIVQVGGLWRPAGEPAFVTLEYVEGADLHKVRDETPQGLLPWSAVQHYMLQLCDALEYAHQKRVAHRDLKPGNLLIDKQGNLKLADFGIAASISNTAGTSTMSVLGMGTPPFMGPQQIQGRPPQASDDIYSLGATFYDLLTSNPPFYQGDIAHQVLNVPPTPIEERLKELGLENDVPEHVRAIIMACLQKNPAHRPSSAKAVRQWIETKGKGADAIPRPSTKTVKMRAPEGSASPIGVEVQPGNSKHLIMCSVGAMIIFAFFLAGMKFAGGLKKGEPTSIGDTNGSAVSSSPKILPAPFDANLVAYYPFSGDAKDKSGNKNHGITLGKTEWVKDRSGNASSALRICDSTAVVDISDIGGTNITVSFWFTPEAFASRAHYILSCDARWHFHLGYDSLGNLGLFDRYEGVGWINSGKRIDVGETYFITLVKEGDIARIMLDAKLVFSATKIFSNATAPLSRIGNGGGDIHNVLGSLGVIDEVRIYDRALSAEEVKALHEYEKVK